MEESAKSAVHDARGDFTGAKTALYLREERARAAALQVMQQLRSQLKNTDKDEDPMWDYEDGAKVEPGDLAPFRPVDSGSVVNFSVGGVLHFERQFKGSDPYGNEPPVNSHVCQTVIDVSVVRRELKP